MELIYIYIINAYFSVDKIYSFKDLKDTCNITIFMGEEYEVKGSCDDYFKNNIKVIKVGK